MKIHTIIGLFISAGLVLTGGAGVIVAYYYNKQHQTIYNDEEVVEKDVYLNMLPGQKKDFKIEVDFAWSSDAKTSLWFTNVDEYSAKYVSVSARQGDKQLFVDDEGSNIYEIKNYVDFNRLQDKTYIDHQNKDFVLSFYLSNYMVEAEVEMQFTFHMSFNKTV